ncbi:MAG TPA: class I SAM-dependent methyltransferase, partial [Rhabdochlamydiaceae bacterium]
MPATAIQTKLSFFAYRLSTILKSFKTLYTLPQEKVDAFMESYIIYDHDWANEEELIRVMGPDYYNQVQKKLVDYYSVLNHLCALGSVEKMYIPPIMDMSKGIIANQTLFEKKMAADLSVKAGGCILDIGCGRGRIASHIATETGAHVIGMNIDTNQLEAARRFAKGKNLTQQINFIQGDLNKLPLPFADVSLDGVYQVQVFSYSKDLEKLFADIYRVLKPGGRVACLDWFQLDKYDPKNPEHADLMRRIKPLIGAIGTPLIEDFTRAMEKAGFKVLINENASING